MLTQAVVSLNRIAGGIASVMLAPIAWLPGWLSATVIAIVTGIVMLVAFKYTSNQQLIHRTRNQIKANLLALSLFRDDLRVGLRIQRALLVGAGKLLLLSFVPMLVMLVPMCLVLGQLALWFQARPLSVGEEAVVTVHLAPGSDEQLRPIQLVSEGVVSVVAGPVRVPEKNLVCWNLRADRTGLHELAFQIGAARFTKELAVGSGFLPVSLARPAWDWSAVLLHPREQPFPASSPVQSIEVTYPVRSSWITGTDWWLVYWFAISMVAAFVARPFLNVSI